MVRHLFGRLLALWRPAAAPPEEDRRGTATAKDGQTMDVEGPAGGVGLTAGGKNARPAASGRAFAASGELLARAMLSLGIDGDDFAERESLWLMEMRAVCHACDARSRCRRDLGTGDFARRYRHYCPVSESLARIASGRHLKAGAPGSSRKA